MNSVRRALSQLVHQLEHSYSTLNQIDISRSAILYNLEYLKAVAEKSYAIPVLKSNAYGHGIDVISEILDELEVPYVAVDGYHEAMEVQAASDLKVLVMGAILPENISKLDLKNVTYVIQDMAMLQVLTNISKPIKIHLEFNTGMNRQGFEVSEVKSTIQLLKDNEHIQLEGIMSHLYDADNPGSTVAVKKQSELFDEIVMTFKRAKLKPQYIHLQQTAGVTKPFSKTANTIRPGIGVYGINPLDPNDPYYQKLSELKPAMSFKSKIIKIRQLKVGEGVSYNHDFVTSENTKIAVLPVGYFEALPRELSGKLEVEVNGQYAKQVGKICMNHSIIDVSGIKARIWDDVEVISRDKTAPNSIQSLVNNHKVYPYSMLVNMAPDTRREIVE